MAMVEMMNKGYLKHIISQNIDGLHRKSGIPENKITELHGNSNTEICQKCQSIYLRDYRTRTSNNAKEHKTGRKCDNTQCNGELQDTIINFGENLRKEDF
jgi:NAD-dependent SIR2 family protein deacetylase